VLAVDCRYLRERPSGIAPYTRALVDHLPVLFPDRHFVFFKHPKAPARLSYAPNVHELVVPFEANGPATMWAMSRLVDWRGVALYHGTFNSLPAGLASRMKTIVSVHDVMWLLHPEWARGPGLWGRVETLFYRDGLRRALRDATRIVTISEASRREIARVDAAAGERTRVTMFGFGDEWRPPRDEERAQIAAARDKWAPGCDRYVLTVGQFAPYKNHAAVVRAFARAFGRDRAHARTHLLLVQRLGEGTRILGELARKEGIEGRVRFLRDVPFDELRALFWGATLLCHPSLYEGFGNAPGEAMAAGCPVVTSNRSSMVESSEGAGILVDPESDAAISEAMRAVADDDARAAKMRADGLVRAERFRWPAVMGRLAEAYREVLTT
jgi:glycosyltransferase involved in cell wall biosynthesis